jgi:hypothetical protein
MKNLYIALITILIVGNVKAQSPEKMSYQSVIRDAGNALVTNQSVGMQLSILQGSATGTAVYVETQTPTSNTNGLVSVEIGSGTVVSGTFNTIDWSAGPYFIKTEADPTGGVTYSVTGTSQLMSVPYALHAKTAENVVNDQVDDADADATNELISSTILDGDTLKITEGGITNSINLTNLRSELSVEKTQVFTVNATPMLMDTDTNFVKIYTNTNYGDLVIENTSSGNLFVIENIGAISNNYVLSAGTSQTVVTGTSREYVKLVIQGSKHLTFEGINRQNGWIVGLLYFMN